MTRGRPKAKSLLGNTELDKAEEQFEKFDENVKSLTLDRMNEAPKPDIEPQTKIAQKDIDKQPRIYLKPIKQVADPKPFNEDYRGEWEFAKEVVNFIAENKEVIGETVTLWTKPFAGVPCQMWEVPTNKPVWGPRYLAERLKGCCYHRLIMDESQKSANAYGHDFGSMVVDTTIQRIDAYPVSERKSIFMGAGSF